MTAGLPVALLTPATIATLDPLARAVATVRRFCDRQGVCYQKSQRYLAAQAGLPLAVFNRALHRAAALGIWRLLPRQHCRQRGSIAFNPEHLVVTREKPARLCSTQRNTKGKAREESKRSPPVSPPEGGDAERPLDRNVGGEGDGIEAEGVEPTPEPAPTNPPPAPVGVRCTKPRMLVAETAPQNLEISKFEPAHDEAQPFYRNRQRRPGDPPKPRRKRRRERRKDDLAIIEEVLRRRYPEEAGDGLPPPEIEILPPDRRAAVRNYDGPSGVIMNLWLGAQYALEAREARRQAEDGLGDDPAERLLAAGGLA